MAEQDTENSRKINIKMMFKIISRTILVIVIIFIFVMLSGTSVSLILKNDSADYLADQDERKELESWVKED